MDRDVSATRWAVLGALAWALGTPSAPSAWGDGVALLEPAPNPPNAIGSSLLLHPELILVGVAHHRSLGATGTIQSLGGVLAWQRGAEGEAIGSPSLVLSSEAMRACRFGESIAAHANWLAIGAPGWNASTSLRASGRVIIYSVANGSLVQTAALGPTVPFGSSVPLFGLEFGASLAAGAFGGDPILAVGVPGDRTTATLDPTGRVAIYQQNDESAWTEIASIASPTPPNARFAHAVALTSQQLLVAAPGGASDAPGAPPIGHGRVFAWPLANLTSAPLELQPAVTIEGDRFGWSMASAGSLIAIGAPSDECESGTVSLFRHTAGNWTLEATLTPPRGDDIGWRGFGSSLALAPNGMGIAIGSGGVSSAAGDYGHRAALFVKGARGWTLQTTYTLSPNDPACTAVALDGSTLLIADPASGAGRVLAYPVELPDAPQVTGDLDGDGAVGPSDLALLLGAWGEGAGSPADLDFDGSVGPADLAIVLGAWSFGGGA